MKNWKLIDMDFKRFTINNLLINGLITTVYILFNYLTIGLRPENYYLVAGWWLAFYVSAESRKFVLNFSFFIVFWILYDSMRILPNYEVSAVHIKEPYELEKSLFGIEYQNSLLTPNEFFLATHNKILDFLSGFFYINWIPVPIGFAVYLYITDKKLFLQYSIAFLLVNIVGFIVYYIYPAAPPWYVQKYGFDLHIGVPGNRAGLARFDELIGVPLFAGIYNKNANVLAAMPSLHAAYPVVVLFYAYKKQVSTIFRILFIVFLLGIWFSAVYSSHHYIIDVVLGVLIAVFVLFLFNILIKVKTDKKANKGLKKI